MKRYIFGLLILLSTLLPALTSCSDGLVPEPAVESAGTDCFNLVVKVPVEANSRAVADPVTDLNEFKVRTVHFYFYVYNGHDDATSKSIHDCIVTEVFDQERTLRVGLPDNALKADGIFGTSGTKCIVYAVANVVDDTLLPEGTPKTIDELKATAIGSSFDQTKVQDAFAMDGRAEVTLVRDTRTASGEITLERAAAKLTLSVDLPASISVTGTVINQDGTTSEGETIEYHSRPNDMHVWIYNGVKNSKLNTLPIMAANDDLYYNEIRTDEGIGSAFTYEGTMEKYKYIQNVPFYSYPNMWEADTPDGNTYLTLVVPWTYTENNITNTVTTYYRLPVQREECFIKRNTHYDMRVTIGRLGSTDPQTPTDMTVDWNYAIPWNQHEIPTEIKAIRYLLLNVNYYDSSIGAYAFEMNNETETNITFGTSHEVEIESVTMLWRDYYNNVNRTQPLRTTGSYTYSNIAGYNADSNYAGIEVDNKSTTLKFKRNLRHIAWSNNSPSISSDNAFCSYTFEIILRHKDDHSKKATVRITQYPPIYITNDKTPAGTRFVNNNNDTYNSGTNWNPNYKGFYYNTDDGADRYDSAQKPYYLGSIHDIGSSGASNPYTYVISISRFGADEKKEYIVADPRTRDKDNLHVNDNNQAASAAWSMTGKDIMSGSNRLLMNYFPADGSTTKKRYIAPKIRIASQWGVTYSVTKDGAKRRCASYQENGRPAGRWRVPTIAEIEFIATLSSKYYIPFLFGDDSNKNNNAKYWCASGVVNVYNSRTNPSVTEISDNSIHAVRCVYDEWYWGNDTLVEADKSKFTWGDRPRSVSRNGF